MEKKKRNEEDGTRNIYEKGNEKKILQRRKSCRNIRNEHDAPETGKKINKGK